MAIVTATSVLLLTALCAVVGLIRLARRLPENHTPLIDAIEQALPQTQCAQCGYPGCRPYAEAVARHGESINLCPPGGSHTQKNLATLTGQSVAAPLTNNNKLLAVIDENECIGCVLCINACPVDAIVGAAKFMHTVLPERCTGCELCVPPCPVNCISLIELTETITWPQP